MTETSEKFIEEIMPHALKIQSNYGVPASIVIAQAALESGWGEHVKGNNYFGIKADDRWHGPTTTFATHEFKNGQESAESDPFRHYSGLAESVANYGQFLKDNPIYAAVLNASNANEAADALQHAGYATEPDYADTLKDIIRTNNLTRFDDAKYKNYTEGARFQQTRVHFDEQRKADTSGAWDQFMSLFSGLLDSILSSLKGLFQDAPQNSIQFSDAHHADQNSIQVPPLANKRMNSTTKTFV